MNTSVTLPDTLLGQQTSEQPTLYLNWQTELASGTILDNSYMRLVSFSGQEQLSNPFTFTLTLHGNTDSAAPQYSMRDLIGRSVSVGICLRDSKEGVDNQFDPVASFKKAMQGGDKDGFTFFNGMVTGFSMSAPGQYTLTMKPAIWRLMLTNDYKIHSQKSIRTLIESILDKHRVAYNTRDLMGDTNSASCRIQDWFQAGETDYELLQRMFSKANIHYYFVYTPTSHQIVFSNKASYPNVFTDNRKLKYTYSNNEELERADVLTQYNYSQEMASTGVHGVFTRQEAAWESDYVAGEMSFYTDPTVDLGELPYNVYKVLQYGGSSASVSGFSSQLADMAGTAATELDGSSHNPEIRVGHKVQLEEGVHSGPANINTYLNNRWFVFTQAQHQASLDGSYSCTFKATESSGLITPFNARDTHQGTVLAQVIAHGNGTEPTTWKYYEKNNFDPETSVNTDGSASNSGQIDAIDDSDPFFTSDPTKVSMQGVYVRFTTDAPDTKPTWVKLSASMQTCPEIGVIVSVARASDESELPEIQQMVQANGSKVVTPSGWTANSHVGNSYSTNYGDSKSIRYGRSSTTNLDAAISKITEEYDTGLYRDSSFSQGGSYSYSTSENGRSGVFSKSESYGNTNSHHEGDLSESYSDVTTQTSTSINGTVDSTSTINVSSTSHHHNLGDTTSVSQVDGLSKSTSTVNNVESNNTTNGYMTSTSVNNGKVTTTSTNNAAVTSTSTNNADITSTNTHNGNQVSTSTHTGNTTSTNTVSGNTTTTSTTTGNLNHTNTVTGSTTSTSTNNGSTTSTNTNNGSVNTTNTTNGSVTSKNIINGSSNSTNSVGSSVDHSTTGSANRVSMTGAVVSTNLVGASMDTSLSGVRGSVSLTGSTNDVSIVGSSVGVSIKGQSSGIDITGAGLNLTLTPGVVTMGITGIQLTTPIMDLVI